MARFLGQFLGGALITILIASHPVGLGNKVGEVTSAVYRFLVTLAGHISL